MKHGRIMVEMPKEKEIKNMNSVFENILRELEEMSSQKQKSFEELMGELDKVHADADSIVKMGLSPELELLAITELGAKKAKVIKQMHDYVDTL